MPLLAGPGRPGHVAETTSREYDQTDRHCWFRYLTNLDRHVAECAAGCSARGEQRARVQRLVEPESAAAWQFDGSDEPPALPCHLAAELHALSLELAYGRFDVVAHEIELITAAVRRRRVRGELRRGQREDKPALASVDRREP